MNDRLIGLLSAIVGIILIIFSYKMKIKHSPDLNNTKASGYIGGILFIIAGVLLMLGVLKWR